jgi:hypothetical protein
MPVVNILQLSHLTDGSIISSTTGKNIGTDMMSLLDVNEDGRVNCGEVWSAICLTNSAIESEREGPGCEDSGMLNGCRDDAEVDGGDLQVPSKFEDISYDWTAPSASQPALSQSQQEVLQSCMKPFIQTMLIGVMVRLRLEPGEAPNGDPSGQSIDAMVSLSEDFSILFIAAGGAQRSVPIKAVSVVRPPEKCDDSEKCVDLLLIGDRFVRFNFDTEAQAKFFGTCMRLLVKASRSGKAETPTSQTQDA